VTNHWIKVGYITQEEDENNEGYVVMELQKLVREEK